MNVFCFERDPTSKQAVHKEFPAFGSGPIRAFGMPPTSKPKSVGDPNSLIPTGPSGPSKAPRKDNSPLSWKEYFDA